MRPQQGTCSAFVPLSRLQQELAQPHRVNAILTGGSTDAGALTSLLKAHATLEDYGLTVRAIDGFPQLAVESDSGFIDPPRAAAIQRAAVTSGTEPHPVFSYLANTIRDGDREVPYSLVTAMDLNLVAGGAAEAPGPPGSDAIVLNDWTARALEAKTGDRLTLEYYVWRDTGTSKHAAMISS